MDNNMNGEIDFNKIAAEFFQEKFDSITKIIKRLAKGTADKVRLHLDSSYKDYIKTLLERHSKVKSFFIRNEPVYLYDFYVELDLSAKPKKMESPGIRDILKVSPFSIITGSAGSGKSMLMRHLILNAILSKEKIPVFIELRQLNQDDSSLREIIQKVLYANKFRLDDEFIEKALDSGHFVIFLDGLDEVALDKRRTLSREILSIAEKYSENGFVVSSRPDNILEGWPGFIIYEVAPLTQSQAQELISKLPFDEDLKSKFQVELGKELFVKHRSFLSNPLLLSIMLLTYGQGAHIPDKLNVFYNQAYEALFQRHDALKGGFQRKRLTRLDIQDFAKVFSAFSLQTYDKNEIEFSRMEALGYIDKAKMITQLDYSNEDYLNDALQAVCLLVEEGLMIVFAHRSFQEYFTAQFICEAKPEIQERLIKKYNQKLQTDTVMKLLYELKPDILEIYYILPGIKKLCQFLQCEDNINLENYLRFLKIFDSIIISEDSLGGRPSAGKENTAREFFDLILFILNNCGHLIDWNGFQPNKNHIDYLWKKYGKSEQYVSISTKELNPEDDFVKEMSHSTGFVSIITLNGILRIGKILEGRRRESEESLLEILS